ncbi:hypothetical protein NEOC95_000499 [Neochlamydia sp. AcF95]|nr:hypothetical protein [Neochlamydia sp. AcF95]
MRSSSKAYDSNFLIKCGLSEYLLKIPALAIENARPSAL